MASAPGPSKGLIRKKSRISTLGSRRSAEQLETVVKTALDVISNCIKSSEYLKQLCGKLKGLKIEVTPPMKKIIDRLNDDTEAIKKLKEKIASIKEGFTNKNFKSLKKDLKAMVDNIETISMEKAQLVSEILCQSEASKIIKSFEKSANEATDINQHLMPDTQTKIFIETVIDRNRKIIECLELLYKLIPNYIRDEKENILNLPSTSKEALNNEKVPSRSKETSSKNRIPTQLLILEKKLPIDRDVTLSLIGNIEIEDGAAATNASNRTSSLSESARKEEQRRLLSGYLLDDTGVIDEVVLELQEPKGDLMNFSENISASQRNLTARGEINGRVMNQPLPVFEVDISENIQTPRGAKVIAVVESEAGRAQQVGVLLPSTTPGRSIHGRFNASMSPNRSNRGLSQAHVSTAKDHSQNELDPSFRNNIVRIDDVSASKRSTPRQEVLIHDLNAPRTPEGANEGLMDDSWSLSRHIFFQDEPSTHHRSINLNTSLPLETSEKRLSPRNGRLNSYQTQFMTGNRFTPRSRPTRSSLPMTHRGPPNRRLNQSFGQKNDISSTLPLDLAMPPHVEKFYQRVAGVLEEPTASFKAPPPVPHLTRAQAELNQPHCSKDWPRQQLQAPRSHVQNRSMNSTTGSFEEHERQIAEEHENRIMAEMAEERLAAERGQKRIPRFNKLSKYQHPIPQGKDRRKVLADAAKYGKEMAAEIERQRSAVNEPEDPVLTRKFAEVMRALRQALNASNEARNASLNSATDSFEEHERRIAAEVAAENAAKLSRRINKSSVYPPPVPQGRERKKVLAKAAKYGKEMAAEIERQRILYAEADRQEAIKSKKKADELRAIRQAFNTSDDGRHLTLNSTADSFEEQERLIAVEEAERQELSAIRRKKEEERWNQVLEENGNEDIEDASANVFSESFNDMEVGLGAEEAARAAYFQGVRQAEVERLAAQGLTDYAVQPADEFAQRFTADENLDCSMIDLVEDD